MNRNKRWIGFAGALTLAGAAASPASAAVTIEGTVTATTHSVDPGLVIFANPLAFPSVTLNNIGDFEDRLILNVGTLEGSVNLGEDTRPYPILVDFNFTSPSGALGAAVSGSTFGFMIPLTSCGLIAGGCGRVDWGAPSIFNFGNGGQFSVQLFDGTFGTPGSHDVRGRFTLLSDSTPAVPEPTTWAMMLIGFGFIGGAMRSAKRRQKIALSYA